MVLFIWAEIVGTPDRTELMTLTNSLPPLRLPHLFASSSTFLHPLWNSLQTEHSSKKQFFKVTYSTWCMLSLHRQCCPKRTNNLKYYNSLWHSKKPQYRNKNAFYLCTKIWRCVGETSKKALWRALIKKKKKGRGTVGTLSWPYWLANYSFLLEAFFLSLWGHCFCC